MKTTQGSGMRMTLAGVGMCVDDWGGLLQASDQERMSRRLMFRVKPWIMWKGPALLSSLEDLQKGEGGLKKNKPVSAKAWWSKMKKRSFGVPRL